MKGKCTIDNGHSINWEDSYVFDDKIDVDLEGIDMKLNITFGCFRL